MATYIPIPDVATILSSTTAQSTDLVSWITPLLALVLGLFGAAIVLVAIKGGIMRGIKRVGGGGRRGRGRRRR